MIFRSSSINNIMPGKRKDWLKSTESYLRRCWVEQKYGRDYDITSKYLEKGLEVEEDSITILSTLDKNLYVKNEKRFTDDYTTGEPDIITDNKVIDIKSSWDIFTFFDSKYDTINDDYYGQLQDYMRHTGKEKAELVYCLIDTPESLLESEYNKAYYRDGIQDPETFEQVKLEIKKRLTYPDIPASEKVHRISIDRDDEYIALIKERCELCNKWIKDNLPEL